MSAPVQLLRLFISVSIDEKIKTAAAALVEELSKAKADVKWVAAENLHLTLSFLGDTSAERINDIHSAIQQTLSGQSPFEIEFDRLGAFGAPARPRVIWLGIGKGAQVLSKLASGLRTNLNANGITTADEPGREFSAHLTLGRVRGPRGIKLLIDQLHSVQVPLGLACRVDKVLLYQSRLSYAGPAYAAVREAPFPII